jgi:hypothetical protein
MTHTGALRFASHVQVTIHASNGWSAVVIDHDGKSTPYEHGVGTTGEALGHITIHLQQQGSAVTTGVRGVEDLGVASAVIRILSELDTTQVAV